jgi:uncharacterized membrane protein YbhN (UPF0104 family)
VARWAFAVLPLIWLGRRVDPGAALHHAAAIGAGPVLGALALALFNVVLGAARWAALMRAYGADRLPPFPRMVRDILVAAYFNVLPSGLAGDVVRALRIKPYAPDLGAALTVIAMERVAGLIALLAITAIAALGGPGLAAGPAAVTFRIGCAAAGALSIALVVLPWAAHRSPSSRAFVARLPLGEALLLRVAPARRPSGALLALALSFGTQAVAMAVVEVLLYRLVDRGTLIAAAGTIPFAILLSYVPITPGAVLQREAVYAIFLGLVGISADRAVAVAALVFSVQLAIAAVGGAIHAAERIGWLDAEHDPPP